ncbi:ATP phosphoribosyltransferase regulatory subunit [Marinobacterium arenosum]|uniref:ATP phosphoribosyltransferase regulatory subunit n=1 Tax=Marinobacterium arenosum TaxID=2862496 RepID=UPI001C9626E3|nr:ATP phosphoribosyltransferase regulatory subunit [Marinobacterium arenosum]MBY4677062.1 ATP phosphoribosyltransferase regulatory subunit [Marinobacterium arenosum]
MALADRWLLPDGVKEVLAPDAHYVEALRRRMLDLYHRWGYELVMPPLMEHLDSLLTGVGRDLDLNTFKLTDQLSGRTLGVRADITPQVARIDAHRMHTEGVNRLCYCGSVLHTHPAQPLASRNPTQVGAEIYGHAGIESDLEVISLMLETLAEVKADHDLSLDLGHVDIFGGLMAAAALDGAQQAEYRDILERKALPELAQFVDTLDGPQVRGWLAELPRMIGGVEVLARAQQVFAEAPAQVAEALQYLQRLADTLQARYPQLDLYFDLSELRGYNYHTGVVFAAYVPTHGQAVAKGGRYDEIGRDFGRARPATGFSADLKTLAELSREPVSMAPVVVAPAGEDESLLRAIRDLRAQGERVVQALPGAAQEDAYSHQLVLREGQWVIAKR